MKKIILAFIAIFAGSTLSAQNTIDDIFTNFAKAKQANYVNLDPSEKDSGNQKETPLPNVGLGYPKVIQVLDLEECSDETKEEFRAIKIVDNEEYSTLIKTKEEDGTTHILMRKQGEVITEFIVIDSSDPVIVRMKGEFKKEDIDRMVAGQNKK